MRNSVSGCGPRTDGSRCTPSCGPPRISNAWSVVIPEPYPPRAAGRRWRRAMRSFLAYAGRDGVRAQDDEGAVLEAQLGPAGLGWADEVALAGGVVLPAGLHRVVGDVQLVA